MDCDSGVGSNSASDVSTTTSPAGSSTPEVIGEQAAIKTFQ
jgi:hypothetical protein